MRVPKTLVAALSLLLGSSLRGTEPERLVRTESVDLRSLLGRLPDRNVLKLFRASADPTTGRVYVAGILTSTVGVLEAATQTWSGTLDTAIDGTALKYLALDAASRTLYVHDATRGQLHAIDLGSGARTGSVSTPSVFGSMVPDGERGLLYVSAGEGAGLRAYDARTLERAFEAPEVGTGVSQMALDRAGGRLWLLDGARSGPEGRLLAFDLARRSVVAALGVPLPAGQRARFLAFDAARARLFVSVPGRYVVGLSEAGTEELRIPLTPDLEMQQLLVDSPRRQLLGLFLEPPAAGEEAATGGLLRTWDADGGRLVSELRFGDKVHSLVVEETTGRAYCPNGDASILWSVDSDRTSVTPIRIGDSLEQVVLALGGSLVVVNSRLGGSYLVARDLLTGATAPFVAGKWPIPVRADAAGERLLVLDAWDSTVSVFRAALPPVLERTVPLGIPAGTTDRLPDLAVESARRRVWAAYPEFGSVTVVEWETGRVAGSFAVPGFRTGDVGGGPGQLQVAVNEAAGRAFVLSVEQRRLFVLDASGAPRLLEEVDLPPVRLSADSPNASLLFVDSGRSRLYAGVVELDAATGRPTGRQLPTGQRVFAVDERNGLLWADAVERTAGGARSVAVALDLQTLELRLRADVGPARSIPPEMALDPARGKLLVGWMTSARLDVWDVLSRPTVAPGGPGEPPAPGGR